MTDSQRPDDTAWQIAEINAGIDELDSGNGVSHDLIARWLESWGKPDETAPPFGQPGRTQTNRVNLTSFSDWPPAAPSEIVRS